MYPDIWHSCVLLLCTPKYTVICDKQELHWVQKFDTSALCRGALSRLLKTELPDSKVRCQRMIGGGEAQHPSFHRSSYIFVLYTLYFVLFHRSSYRTPSPSMIFVSCAILSWYNQQSTNSMTQMAGCKEYTIQIKRGRVMTRTRKACFWAEQNIQLWPYSLESYSFASISLSEKFIVNTEAAFSKYCTVKHEYGGCILSTVSTISKFGS